MRGLARLTCITIAASAMLAAGVAGASSSAEPVRLPIVIGGEPTEHSVVVRAGDHLWLISARHLDAVFRRQATDTEISPYWREVIAVNTPNLRSGDPNLIFPGEVVTLPENSG